MYRNNIYDFLAQMANEQGNYNLSRQCQQEKIISMYEQEQEHKRLVKEITDEILKRLSLSVDTKSAIAQIDGLNEALKRLGAQ
ncbi:MAG: hypothetical protein IJ379_09680 [Lachnospiraceae bacterium]|nr:hypothetical protein [Lachnospiraceae bacterium]